MVSINTNMSSAIAANSLTRNDRVMTGTMERLSTGLRINSAKDDAAGLAITSKMTDQINGLTQSVRNANDAISMIQVAEGAMKEVTNMFQRMRELAVQAISDSNTSNDRLALNNEFKELSGEIKRIASNTQWNGINILDDTIGSKGVSTFQIGANANQTIDVDFGNLATSRVSASAAAPSIAEFDVSAITVGSSGKIIISDGAQKVVVDSASIVDGSAAGSALEGKTDELITAIQAKTQVAGIYSVDVADSVFSGATSTSNNLSFTFEGKTATLPLWKVTPAVSGVYSTAISANNLSNTGQVVVSDGTATVTLDQTVSPYASVAELALAIQSGTNYNSLMFTVDVNSAGDSLDFTYKVGAAVAGADEPTIVIDSRSVKAVYSSNLTDSQAGSAGTISFSDGTNTLTISEKTNPYTNLEDLAATIRSTVGYAALSYTITAEADKLIYTAKNNGAITTAPTISINNRNDRAVYSAAVTVSNVAAAGQIAVGDGTTTVTVAEPASEYADLGAMVSAIQAGTNYSSLLFTVSAGSNALVFTAKTPGVVAADPTVTVNGRSTTGVFSTSVSAANVDDAGQIVIGDGTTTVTVAEPGSAYTSLGAMVTAIQGNSDYAALNYTVSAGTDELVFTAKTPGNQADPTVSVNSRAKPAVYSAAVTVSNVAAAGQIAVGDGTTTVTVAEPASEYADLGAMVSAIQAGTNYSSLLFTVSAGSNALVFTAKTPGVVAADPTVTVNGRSTTGVFSTSVSAANVDDAGQIVIGDGTTTVTVAEPGSAYTSLGAMVTAIQGNSDYAALNYTVSAGTDELVFTAKTPGNQADPTVSVNSRAKTAVYSAAVTVSNVAAAGQIAVGDGTTTVTVAEPASEYADLGAMVSAIQAGTNYSSLLFTVSAGSNALVFTAKTPGVVAADPTVTVNGRSTTGVFSTSVSAANVDDAGQIVIGDGTTTVTVAEPGSAYTSLGAMVTAIQGNSDYAALNYTVSAGTDELVFTAKTPGNQADPTVSVNSRAKPAVYSAAVTVSNVAAAGQIAVGDGTTTVTVAEPASEYADLGAMVSAIQAGTNYSSLLFTVSAGSNALVFTAKTPGTGSTAPTVTVNGRSTTGVFSTSVSAANVDDAGQIVIGDGTTTVTVAEPGSAYTSLGAMVTAIQGNSDYAALNYTVSAGTDELVFTAKTPGNQADPTVSVNSRAKTAVYSAAVTVSNVAAAGQIAVGDGTTTVTVAEPASEYADLGAMVSAIQAGTNYSSLLFTVSAGSNALVFTAKTPGVVAADPTVTVNGRSTTGVFSTSVSAANVDDAGQIVIGDGTTTVTVAEPGSAYTSLGAMVTAIQGNSDYAALNYTVSAGTDELVFTAKTPGNQADPTVSITGRSATAVYETAVTVSNVAAAGKITVGDGTTTVTVAEPASAYEDLDAMVTAIKADASYSALKYTVSAGTDSLVFTAKISGEVGAGADPNLTIDVRRTPAIYYSDITTLAKIGSVAIGDGVNAFTLAQSPNPYGNVTELATAIQSIPQYDTLLYTVTAGSDALIFTAKTSGISSTTPTIVVNSRPIVALYSSALDAAALADTGEVVISDGKINVTLAKQTNAPASIVELAEQLKGTDGYDDLDFTVVAGTDALEFHYKYVGAVVTSPTITIDSRTATGSNIANPPPTNETTRGTNSVDIASSVTGAAGTDSVAGSASDIVTATSGTVGTTIGVATTVDIDTVDVDGTSSTVANTVATTAAGKASGTGGDVTTIIDTDTADIDGTSSTVANTVATTAAGIASGTGGDVTTIIDTDTADIDGTSSTVANTVATTAAGIASGTGGDVTTAIDTDTADIDGTSSTVADTVATTAAGIASGTGGDVTTAIDTDTADIDGTSSTVADTVATTAAGIASGTGGDVTTAIDTDTADIDGTSSTVADTVATTAAGIASGTGGDVTTAIDTDTADVDGTSSTVANTVATTAAGIASGTGGDVTTAIDTDTADVDGTSSTVANTVATTAAGIASGTGGDVTKAIDTDTADVDGTSSTVANTVATTAAGIASGTGGNVSSSVDIDTADVDGTSSTVANTVGTTIAGAESGTGGNVSSSVDTDTSDVDGTSATLANTVTTTTAGAQGASGGVTATLSANTAGVDAGAGAVSTSVSNTTVGADDASQATYTTAAGAISALNSMLDSQGIFFTAAAAGDTGGGSAGITFTADDGTATDGYLATDPTATISGSSAPVTERTAGSDAYSELGFTVSAGEAGGIKMSYKTVGSVDAPTINNAGSSVTVATTTAGVDAEVTAGNVAGNVAARGDISFTGEVAGGDVVTVKINNNSYASFTLDNASASAINSNTTHTPDLGGANDATGDPVIAQTAVSGVAAIYTMALNDTAANSLADGFAISDGTTNIAVADMSAVTSVAEVVAAIEADAAYSTLSYAISEAYGGLTFIAKMQTPIASAAEPTGTGLTTAINTAGLAPVAAIKASEGMTFSGNLGFDVGTLSASVVNGKLRVSGSIANDVGTTPTFSMSNIEVSRGVHAPVGGADITTRRLASDALSLLDTAIKGVNTTRAGMGASMSRLDHAVDNLQNVAQSTAAARSRVLDADYAKETTELARTKIIQQAGMAMLSQSNQDKQSVLSLLK